MDFSIPSGCARPVSRRAASRRWAARLPTPPPHRYGARLLGAGLLGVFLAVSTLVRADTGTEHLKAGLRAYDDLEPERAIEFLGRAVESPDLDASFRARAQLYLGLAHFELGRPVPARRAWQAAFRLYPALSLPAGLSPKTRARVEAARDEVQSAASSQTAPIPRSDSPDVEAPGRVDVTVEQAQRQVRPISDEERAAGVVEARVDRGATRIESEALPGVDSTPSEGLAVAVPVEEPAEDDGGEGAWWAVGIGAGVAVVAASVVAGVLLAQGEDGACAEEGGCVRFSLR